MFGPSVTLFFCLFIIFIIIILWKYRVTAQCGEEEVCLQFNNGLYTKDANNVESEVMAL